MPHDPLHDVAEILGEPAEQMRNPANAEYRCPFIAGTCTKTSHQIEGPFPVCSIYRRGRAGDPPDGPPISVCPNRFLEAPVHEDVMRECWTAGDTVNPQVVSEVQMEKFGKVDFVVADMDAEETTVRDFISVELQAVDITGSYLPSYEAIINSQVMERRHAYGFNWANVRKRFIAQLIAKGYYHHQWRTRIAAVLQTDMFDEIRRHAAIQSVPVAQANIVFLLYQFHRDGDRWRMELENVVPTLHSIVMNAILYEQPPDRAAFERRILERHRRDSD